MDKLRSLGWACALWWFACVAVAQPRAADVPNPRSTHDGWITDPASQLGALAPELEALLSALHRDTQAEVGVAILPSIGEQDPREFATALLQQWGIGRRGHDDGLLVLHVLDQRRLEIETGYGLEAVLTDVECAWLIQDVALPFFRAGKIAEGHAALLRGIDFGIRHPEATREQLLTAAGAQDGSAQPSESAESEETETPPLGPILERFGPFMLLATLFAGLAAALRKLGFRSLYRNPKRRPKEMSGCLVSVFSMCACIFVAAAWLTEHAWVAWWGVITLGGLGAFLTFSGLSAFREGRRRYAPRTCSACSARMTLVSDDKDDRYLDEGQRAEERVRSADYFVWRCTCGNLKVERYADDGDAKKCERCGYQTEQLKSHKQLKAPTTRATGLAERHYLCAHCKAQRFEKVELPRVESASSGRSGSRGSSSGSSGGGSSFGGGRSGGGGAGGSY